MNDRIVGIFADLATARKAADDLASDGVEADRITVQRVLDPEHRGLSDADKVHSIIHAPRIEADDPVDADAGTIILVVDAADEDNDPSENVVRARLRSHGAVETSIIEATPGLDL